MENKEYKISGAEYITSQGTTMSLKLKFWCVTIDTSYFILYLTVKYIYEGIKYVYILHVITRHWVWWKTERHHSEKYHLCLSQSEN